MWVYNCGCGGLTVSPMNRCAAVRTAGHWGHTEVQLYSGITAQAFHSVRVSPDTDFTKNKSPGRNQLAIFIGDMLRTALVLWPLLLEGKDPQASSKVTIKAASCPSHASPLCLAMLRSWRGRGTQILVFLVGVWNTYFSWFDLGENISKNVTGWVLNCTLCHGPFSELLRTCDQHVCGQGQ